MSSSTRSWYASLAGAFLLVALLAIVAGHTVPDILNGRSTALAATVAAVVLLIVAAVLALALIAAIEIGALIIVSRFYRWKHRRHAERRRGYLIDGPWS